MTAAIQDDVVRVSPRAVGAGQITLVVSNQTRRAADRDLRDRRARRARGGSRARSPRIAPRGTGRLTIDAREGIYAVHTADEAIRAARVSIGPPRPASQDRVLLP